MLVILLIGLAITAKMNAGGQTIVLDHSQTDEARAEERRRPTQRPRRRRQQPSVIRRKTQRIKNGLPRRPGCHPRRGQRPLDAGFRRRRRVSFARPIYRSDPRHWLGRSGAEFQARRTSRSATQAGTGTAKNCSGINDLSPSPVRPRPHGDLGVKFVANLRAGGNKS